MDAHFDLYQFQDVFKSKAVHAEYVGAGEWETTGLDYSDYQRMATQNRKIAPNRRNPTPPWALDDDRLRAVLIQYLERRALINNPTGDDKQRLERARKELAADIAAKDRILTAQCKRYVEMKAATPPDHAALQKLEVVIEALDTEIRFIAMDCPGVILRVVYLYYRLGWDGVFIAQELHLKPPHIRMLLYRLNKIADPDGSERAAAFKTWRKAPLISKEECERLLELRLAGQKLDQLAATAGHGVETVKNAFAAHGLELPKRPRTEKPEKEPKAARAPRVVKPATGRIMVDPTRALYLWNRGEELEQIADRFAGVTARHVLQSLLEAVSRGELLLRPLPGTKTGQAIAA